MNQVQYFHYCCLMGQLTVAGLGTAVRSQFRFEVCVVGGDGEVT